jgi:hypothetical protein
MAHQLGSIGCLGPIAAAYVSHQAKSAEAAAEASASATVSSYAARAASYVVKVATYAAKTLECSADVSTEADYAHKRERIINLCLQFLDECLPEADTPSSPVSSAVQSKWSPMEGQVREQQVNTMLTCRW